MLRGVSRRSGLRVASLLRRGEGSLRGAYLGATDVESAGEVNLPAFGYGTLGHLCNSSIISSQTETVVHAAVSIKRQFSADSDFLPVTVDYRDRLSARGLVPKGPGSREKHGSKDETLVGRMIDRAMRPLFAEGYVDDLQVLVTCHAADGVSDPTVLGMNAASCALLLSSAPWRGPVGCVRIGRVDGQLIVNPTLEQMRVSTLDLVYAGTILRPVMLEAAAHEVPEEEVRAAMRLAHDAIQPVLRAQLRLRDRHVAARQREMDAVAAAVQAAGLPVLPPPPGAPVTPAPAQPDARAKLAPMYAVSEELVSAAMAAGLETALAVFRASLPRSERSKREGAARHMIVTALRESEEHGSASPVLINMAADEVMSRAFRTVVFEGTRVDGRALNALRTIHAAPDVLPVVHGSSLFQRGDTHVLCSVTLGSLSELLPGLDIHGSVEEEKRPFMLHYDFPPYCTGVVDSIKLNRRMIGHGALAEKAVRAVMPSVDEFPYLVRVFSECTSSSGSSSMASVCGASLALMDAGVPLRAAVAGVSVGIVGRDCLYALPSDEALAAVANTEGGGSAERAIAADAGPDEWLLLTDILGMEDHYGDMDFKIAGTAKGITAIQLDVKLPNGIPLQALEDAVMVSRDTRLKILETMNAQLSASRPSLKPHAPMAALVKFNPERRRYLLGTGSEMARFIRKKYSIELNVDDDADDDEVATAYLFGRDPSLVVQAKSLVQDLVLSVAVGEKCMAVVSSVKDFGATVKITRAQDALLHLSELTHDTDLLKRPITELVAVGQRFEVQVISVNNATGQVRVSRKRLLPSPEENSAFKDALTAQPAEHSLLEPLPEFPVIPPRSFSKDFFKDNVASQSQIAAAMALQAGLPHPSATASAGASDGEGTSPGSDRSRGDKHKRSKGKTKADHDRDSSFKEKKSSKGSKDRGDLGAMPQ